MDRMGGGGEEKSLVLPPPPLPTRVLREKSPTSLLLLYPSLARMSSQALLTPWLWACALALSSAWTAFPTAPRYLLCQLLGICRICSDFTLSSPRGLPARLSNTVTYLSTPPSSLPRSTFVSCFHRTYHLLPYYTVDFLCFLFV